MACHGKLVRDGRAVAAGGFVGVDGGMAILRVAHEADAQAILAADLAFSMKCSQANCGIGVPASPADVHEESEPHVCEGIRGREDAIDRSVGRVTPQERCSTKCKPSERD
jgi:hypothetical protein